MTGIRAQKREQYRALRRHGYSIPEAARQADISVERAHKIEGRSYCDQCGAYVSAEDCVHWDFES